MRRSAELCVTAALALLAACAEPQALLQGTVLIAGEPRQAGIEVTVLGPVALSVATDDEGSWAMRVPAGDYAVSASVDATLEGTVTTTVRVPARGGVEAEPLTFTPTGAISGRVSGPGGEGLEGVSVMVVGGGAALTQGGGAFVAHGVPAGRRDLVAWLPGFQQGRLTGIDVRRGQTAEAPPLELTVQMMGETPRVGTLRGTAWLPGSSDHSGIRVEVEGTVFSTVTASDGSFTLEGVANGIVALAFSKGALWAHLSRVMVVPGTDGFVIDGGLYALERAPVRLRRGTRVLDTPGYLRAVSPDRRWAVLEDNAHLYLWGPHGTRELLPGRLITYVSSALRFVGDPPTELWVAWFDPTTSHRDLARVTLATLAVESFGQPGSTLDATWAPSGPGAAWVNMHTLYLKASASAPEVMRLSAQAGAVVSLRGGKVLAIASGASGAVLHTFAIDGTPLDSLAVTSQYAAGLWLSPDERWALVGAEYAGTTLVDRVTGQSWPLAAGCQGKFSAGSDALLCQTELYTLGAGGPVARSFPRSFLSNFIADGRVVLSMPPELLIVSPSAPDVVVTGLSWEAPGYRVSADGQRVTLLAHIDPLTKTGDVVEVSAADGVVTVLARGAVTEPFVPTVRGAIIGRPRAIGAEVELSFTSSPGVEVPIGRWFRDDFGAMASNEQVERLMVHRFVPGRGIEQLLYDGLAAPGADPVIPLAYGWGGGAWLDTKRFFSGGSVAPPFSESTGVYLVELP